MLKKIKNFLNKKNVFVIFLFIFIYYIILIKYLSNTINNLDELWIFNTARNFANGLLPYRDYNLITTPLLPIIYGLFLKIFGTELIVMRIISSIFSLLIMILIYKNLIDFKIDKNISLLILVLFLKYYYSYLVMDYNLMVMTIGLLGLNIEINRYNKDKKVITNYKWKDVLLGIFIGLSVLFKQTMGITLSIAFCGYKILLVKSKEDFIEFIKIFFMRMISVLIPSILFVLFLIKNNIMSDFLNYAVYGIKEFTNYKSYLDLFKSGILFKTFAVLVPVIIIISLYLVLFVRKNDILAILFAYSMGIIIVVYPISNEYHFFVGSIIPLLMGVYLQKLLYESRIEEKFSIKDELKKMYIAVSVIIIFPFILGTIFYSIDYFKEAKKFVNEKNLKYVIKDDNYISSLNEVTEYIMSQEDEVLILDSKAVAYTIPLDIYNKDYDMLLIGNLGVNGEERLIKDLESKEKTKLLLLSNKQTLNWQTPMEIIRYVKNNYKKGEEISIFEVYEK